MYLSLDKGDHIPFLAGTPYLMYPQTYNQKRFASLFIFFLLFIPPFFCVCVMMCQSVAGILSEEKCERATKGTFTLFTFAAYNHLESSLGIPKLS